MNTWVNGQKKELTNMSGIFGTHLEEAFPTAQREGCSHFMEQARNKCGGGTALGELTETRMGETPTMLRVRLGMPGCGRK